MFQLREVKELRCERLAFTRQRNRDGSTIDSLSSAAKAIERAREDDLVFFGSAACAWRTAAQTRDQRRTAVAHLIQTATRGNIAPMLPALVAVFVLLIAVLELAPGLPSAAREALFWCSMICLLGLVYIGLERGFDELKKRPLYFPELARNQRPLTAGILVSLSVVALAFAPTVHSWYAVMLTV